MEQVNCKICNDLQFIYKKGTKELCPCARIKKLKAYFPLVDIESIKTKSKNVESLLKSIDISKNNLITTNISEQDLNLLILFYLLLIKSPGYLIFNAYELVDIFLGKHPTFQTILSVDAECVVILYGYHEFANVRQTDFLLQLFDHLKRRNRKVLFISRIDVEGASLLNYLKENQWNIVTQSVSSKMRNLYNR